MKKAIDVTRAERIISDRLGGMKWKTADGVEVGVGAARARFNEIAEKLLGGKR